MERWNEYKLDVRTAKEIRDRMKELSLSYTPEWDFETKDADAGSVIAMIFARQMEENIRHYNLLLKKYRVEFANMHGISLHPARPARTFVIMEMNPASKSSIAIKQGTKLLATTQEGKDIVFETVGEVALTSVSLARVMQVLRVSGKLQKIEGENELQGRIPLFCEKTASLPKEELLIWQDFISKEGEIGLRFEQEIEVVQKWNLKELVDPELFQFFMRREEQEIRVTEVRFVHDTLCLKFPKDIEERLPGDGQAVLVMKKIAPLRERRMLTRIYVRGGSGKQIPDFIHDGKTEMDSKLFLPFGEELTAYGECYIGQESVFTRKGAKAVMRFNFGFEVRKTAFFSQEEEELKIIKKRPKYTYKMQEADCYLQEVAVEYFNGKGWKNLGEQSAFKHLFEKETYAGNYEFKFEVPNDWKSFQIGGYEQLCLRIRILRADNCYYRPATHHCPRIENLEISYSYPEGEFLPAKIETVRESYVEDVTSLVVQGRPFVAFQEFPYEKNYLFLGFDAKFEKGPISLFIKLDQSGIVQPCNMRYEYSSLGGFKPLKVIDYTEGFWHSGILLFQPPSDMAKQEIEGEKCYWIRITDENDCFDEQNQDFPILTGVQMNGVEAINVQTKEEQEYFIDQIAANMHFSLYAENILNVDVWVNEKEQLSVSESKQWLLNDPQRATAEYNFLGDIEEFYIKWEETEDFQTCEAGARVYKLNRMSNEIIFGDGVHTRIPRNTKGVAFRIKVRCCEGEQGNVDQMQIHSFTGNRIFVEQVFNPLPAFGGSNMESLSHALQRSSNLLSARKRLVSEQDYIREIQNFSNNIAKVKCIFEQEKISFVLLMKDYQLGAYSFRTIQKELKVHILSHCEATISEEELSIEQPKFIEISIEVWLCANNLMETFSIQNMFQKGIEQFLEPFTENGEGGWEIGSLPKESQIQMMLKSLEREAWMERYSITVAYRDRKGRHETSLAAVSDNPFAICCNGKHQIHITTQKG